MPSKSKKSWREKLADSKDLPKVVKLDAAGEKDITPYWRTLKSGGELNPKYPGGVAGLKRKLAAEGHTVIQKGERTVVQDFERVLHSPR